MGNLVRLLYVHPPMAWVAFLAFGVASLASLLYLWPRTRAEHFDRLAGASAEVGVVFTGLTLVSGSIWGRPTWGAWWVWDPLLTTTALLFVLYLGYLALRRVPGDFHVRARRSAIGALIAFVDVPIVYFSVEWWRSLHQAPTVLNPTTHKTYVHGSMAWTLLLGFVSFTLALHLAHGAPLPPRQAAGPGGHRGPRRCPQGAPGGRRRQVNGYVEAGYLIVLGSLGTYGVGLLGRERPRAVESRRASHRKWATRPRSSEIAPGPGAANRLRVASRPASGQRSGRNRDR